MTVPVLALEDRRHRYGQHALQRLVDEVTGCGPGSRNAALNRAALRAGRLLICTGLVGPDVVAEVLHDAGRAAGLSGPEARATVASALRAAQRLGAVDLPEGLQTLAAPPSLPRPQADTERPAPPVNEVQALWERAGKVWGTPGAAELEARRIDPAVVDDQDLVRVLPTGPLPRWARSRAGTWWESGHRLIVPCYGADGALRSVVGRTFRQDLPDDVRKSLNAWGYTTKSQVFADATGRALLAGEAPTWWNGEVWAAEGAPDFLTLATYTSDAAEQRPAVFGYAAGGWTEQIGARLPESATVLIFAHADDAGQNMAERIAATVPQCRAYVRREGVHGRA